MLVNIRFSNYHIWRPSLQPKKSKRFNNFELASLFFVHFFVLTARLRKKKLPDFTICGGRKHKIMTWTRWSKDDKGEAERIHFLSDIS